MKLQKWQKNSIFNAIKEGGLDPQHFDLDNGESEARLDHPSSGSYFLIGDSISHYVGSYVVGDDAPRLYEEYFWPNLILRISRWVENVKRDVDTPDLWADLRRETDLLGGGSDESIENTPFTPEERNFIEGRFRILRDTVGSTQSLSEEQRLAFDAKIDHLIDAAGRLGRIDWREMVFGTMFQLIVAVAIPVETVRALFLTFLGSTAHFYAPGIQALPGP